MCCGRFLFLQADELPQDNDILIFHRPARCPRTAGTHLCSRPFVEDSSVPVTAIKDLLSDYQRDSLFDIELRAHVEVISRTGWMTL